MVGLPGSRGAADLTLGLTAGTALIVAFGTSPLLGLAVAAAMLALPALLFRPALLFWVCFLSVLVMEEFPSGIGETVERSTRTAFYGKSIGLPGLYFPDVMLGGALVLAFLAMLLGRRRFDIRVDPIAVWLVLLSFAAGWSILLSFLTGNPLAYGTIQVVAGTGYEINQRGAELIAFFQYKNFFMLLLAYLAGILYLQDPQSIRRFVQVMGIAALCYLSLGFLRLALHPEWITQTLPLFYDSQSSWLFALVAFYVVAAWANDLLDPRQTFWLGLLGVCMMLFVLISFRRTMWGAILLAGLLLLYFLPNQKRNRLLVIGSLLAAAMGIALAASPAGEMIMSSLAARVEQTDTKDASTVYRMALFIYFSENFNAIPFFGYGAKPLWNEFVSLGYFRTNLENIHSLYFWLLLRLGYFGFAIFLLGMAVVMTSAWRLGVNAANPHYRVLALMILLAIFMFLFSGIFNPVYAQPRYLIILGIGLALLTRIRQFERSGSYPS